MQSNSGDDSKKESRSDSEGKEPVVVSNNKNTIFNEWQKFIRQFNSLSTQDFFGQSKRKVFCNAAIVTLQSLYDASQNDKQEVIDIKAIIDSLQQSQSNLEIIHLLQSIPNKSLLQKLVRENNISISLGRLIVHIRNYFFENLKYDPEKIVPMSAFEYNKLTKQSLYSQMTTGDFSVYTSKDFFVFTAEGVSSAVNDTKLRLSVLEDQFEKAWNLIKEEFLFPNSPIYQFKITNFKSSEESLKQFIERYQKHTSKNASSLIDDVYYQNQIHEYQRLIAGGQITIYLPRKMNDETYDRITEFLTKISKILSDNAIIAGVQPNSDYRLTNYFSGRVGGTEFNYISSTETARNVDDPVLNHFATALNQSKNTPTL